MDNIPDNHEYCTGGYKPDDIVISGMAGRFPECDTVGELKEALFSKKPLIIHSDRRYEKGACDIPYSSCGLINDIDKLDADFFCITYPSANNLDPASRKCLEVSYEAIVDSGYDPFNLRGMNIGVYNATISDDCHQLNLANNAAEMTTFLRCMIPNRTSYSLDFIGPSITMDTGCSSSAVAFWAAINDLQANRIDAALVTACQIDLDPRIVAAYIGHGVQSTTGNNIPFDANTDGILKTESAVTLFLQKASVARRSYGIVTNTKFIGSGYVVEGITVPSLPMQMKISKEILEDVGVDMDEIDFIEAHGTGTSVGDPIELNALAGAYFENRKKPLYLGSIKSNIGHPEAASGSCGIVKALIAFETGKFPPNFRYSVPNPRCQALVDGKLRVVTEAMELKTPYIPINSFGFGGTLVQVLLKQNPIVYSTKDRKKDRRLPRLVLYPATTEKAITFVFDYIKGNPDLQDEFFALMHKISFTPTSLKACRGYGIFQPNKESVVQIKNCSSSKRPVWFIMTGMGCQWPGMGRDLMQIDVFAESMKKSAEILSRVGIDLFAILTPEANLLEVHRKIIPAFVGIASIGVALVDVLRFLEIQPDGIIGHSTGELVAAYADNCCTHEETILSAYWRGQAVEMSNLPEGAMAAVGMSWEEATRCCPDNVYPACENADDSVTVSGLKQPVEDFVEKLKKQNVFARVVDAYGFAFHSKCILPSAEALKNALSKIMVNPKERSSRWISSSYPESEWQTPGCKVGGANYFVHNLVSKVDFNTAAKKIPSDAVLIEIGPHQLFQSILKRIVGSGVSYVGLMKKNSPDSLGFILESLGKLYNEGLDPKIEKLYPPVKFPVPRGTPMISDLIRWNHTQSFHVPRWTPQSGESLQEFNLEKKDSYLMDHRIDGRSLFPATGYVVMAWEALATKLQKKAEELPVLVENFKIHKATIISNQTSVKFFVNILNSTGSFEISEGNSLVASGFVSELKNTEFSELSPPYSGNGHSTVSGADIYNELKMSGYEYGPAFRGLVEVNMEGTQGLVLWQNRWVPFLDSLLLFFGLINNNIGFCLPTGAQSLKIDPCAFRKYLGSETGKVKGTNMPVTYNPNTNTCHSCGVEIKHLSMDSAPRRPIDILPTLEKYTFVPYTYNYTPEKKMSISHYMHACNKVIDKIGKNLKISVNDFKFAQGTSNSVNFNNYMEHLSADQQLLKILNEISENPSSVKKGRKEQFSAYISAAESDMLNSAMLRETPLRILTEIISENSFRKLSIMEVNRNFPPVLPRMLSIVKNFSYIKFKSCLLLTARDAQVDQEMLTQHEIQHHPDDMIQTLAKENKQDIVVSSFTRGSQDDLQELINQLSSVVKTNGLILLFYRATTIPAEKLLYYLFNENPELQPATRLEKFLEESNLVTLSKITDNFGGSVYLLRLAPSLATHTTIKLKDNEDFSWIEEVKRFLSKGGSETLWLVAENNDASGIVGMVNCLKQEPGGEKIRCVLMPKKDKDLPPFDLNHPAYKDLLAKNLIMNVWRDGSWGSYRHVSIKDRNQLQNVEHSFVNCHKYGDLSSFEWIESQVKYAEKTNQELVHICYSALNFKDVMLATGKLSVGTAKSVGDPQTDDAVLGIEFSGRDAKGRRVAGFVRRRGMATSTLADPLMLIEVPDKWTLEEAATVPVVYATCYYALTVRARLRRGESILIHSGTGGIGLAAINIALHLGCQIFTTVGNETKKKYLQEKYPQIPAENIGCSRDTSFEKMIMERTSGKGVNVVLNSLADDKFQASARCVARHGRIAEIGKYDLALDRKLGLKMFLENISFHGVFLDQLFENTPEAKQNLSEIMQLVKDGIKDGIVKPLDRTVFGRKEIEEAFRYMAKGVHVGKVLLKIRDDDNERHTTPKTLTLPAVPKTYFYSSKVYIVVGGLGGFGIEVTKWILNKGGRNVILTSRYGARTPYHHLCLHRWKKAGYDVRVSTLNVANAKEAEKLLQEASIIGPVGGIFNSAVVLKDAFMECQTASTYKEVCASKATATKLLDDLSRKLCPALDYFVCFSSVSCGRGNAGQTNYGYANSVMERVCERRRGVGLHGLAIQWGIIGEVGVVHRHMGDDAMIAGVSAQSVRSCLEALDLFCQIKSPVVSSYVNAVVTKKTNQTDVLTQISKVLGMKDVSEINATRNFGEMGIDSMVGVEVKQLIENSCDVTLTMQEIFDMKIGDVRSLIEKAESENSANKKAPALVSTTSITLPKTILHTEPMIAINKKSKGTPIVIVNIGDNDVSDFHLFGEIVPHPVFALVWSKDVPHSDLKSLATWYLKLIEDKIHNPVHIIGSALGGSLAFEMALQSSKSNKKVKSISLLNGSSELRRSLSKEKSTSNLEVKALCEFVEQFTPDSVPQLEDQLLKVNTLDQRIDVILTFFMRASSEQVNKSEMTEAISQYVQRKSLIQSYVPSSKLAKDITLIEDPSQLLANDIAEMKELFSQVCQGKVNIQRIFSFHEITDKEAVQRLVSVLVNNSEG